MDEEQEKRELIQQMGSGDNKIALVAVEKLRERGWLTDGSLRGASLIGADLRVADLSKAYLQNVNLTGAMLTGANMSYTYLREANLSAAYLRDARLLRASLHNANLSDAVLRHADLDGAILESADLHSVDIQGADLIYANLDGADFTNAICWHTNFANLDLSNVKGLDQVRHIGPSTIGIDTFYKSKGTIPEAFLRGCGVPDDLITYLPSLMGKAIDFYSCFISYSSQDQTFTDQLAGRMRDKKLRVWYAPEEMRQGEKILDQLEAAIKLHDKVVVVLSKDSIHSPWVQAEIRNAFTRDRQENRRVLFPIRICSYQDLERWTYPDINLKLDLAKEIREYFIPDFSNWKDYDSFSAAFERLLADLRKSEE